jgi:hypothetical protein
VTALLLRTPSGEHLIWGSRRNRKGLDPQPVHLADRARPTRALPVHPRSLAWWIAILFMVGAALFAFGSASLLSESSLAAKSGIVFFVGSLFFTSAAYLQFAEVINEPDPLTGERPSVGLWRREPHKIGWWAVVIQLVGTLLFNMNTFEAMRMLNPATEERFVWAPDAIGSVCFLIASYLAYAEVCHRWICQQPRNISWWIVSINLMGSVAFGVSAVASWVVADTGKMLSASAANLWTLVGAVCFFVAAYLLLPEMTAHSAPRSA